VSDKARPCLISCSVLKEEIEQLLKQGDLDVEVVFVDKYFHIDFGLLEQNLRKTIEDKKLTFLGKIVLLYGDLCLGLNGEMKHLANEYGLVKVDALNCTDCLLGGKGKINASDPDHEFLILHPGMIGFFDEMKKTFQKENVEMSQEVFEKLFSGLKGIILLDTLDVAKKDVSEIEKLSMGIKVVETQKIGLEKLKKVIFESLERCASQPD
jgi:hypothetical protein